MISVENIIVEQLSHYLAWPDFYATCWAEALLGRGLGNFLDIVRAKSVPRKRRSLPSWAPWPWDVSGPVMSLDLDVSDEIYGIICEVITKPASRDVLVSKSYTKENEVRRVKKTVFNDMWRVVI